MADSNVKPVVISYTELCNPDADLKAKIEEGFGYAGLGLILVSGVPNLLELRKQLLPMGSVLAGKSAAALSKIELAETAYSVGWSHGKEKLREGVFDVNKGSFYANPQYDEPTTDLELQKKYYQDYHPNVWPKDDMPELEAAFKALGQLMVSVGELVAHHADVYVSSKLGDAYQAGTLEKVVKTSRTAKGRLLHYFPVMNDAPRTHDSWCTWHNDHSALTALCSAYFTSVTDPATEVACPDPASGLYARTRTGATVKIAIPKDHLAFQIGETSQILTGAILRATPHAVQAPKYPESTTVQRDTLAVFMQPNHDLPLNPPAGIAPEAVAVGAWRPGLTYSEFSKGTVEGYYELTN